MIAYPVLLLWVLLFLVAIWIAAVKRRRAYVISLLVLLIAGGGWLGMHLWSIDRMGKYWVTRDQMILMGEELRDYYLKHGAMPSDVLLYLRPDGTRPVDGWGYPEIIQSTSDQFSITSLGSDHRPGDTGDATDIIVRWKRGDKDLTVISANIYP